MEKKMFSGVEILIAEDNIINYTLLCEIVRHNGLGHYWAQNGLEVLDILATHENIALILMDINMPEMDGITATKEIRKKGNNIPIIFQTAYNSDEDKKECFRAGGNEFLSKPIIKDMLFLVLNKYLNNSYVQQT